MPHLLLEAIKNKNKKEIIIEKGQKARICIVAPSKVAYFDGLDLLGVNTPPAKPAGTQPQRMAILDLLGGGDYTALERAGTGLAQTSTLNGQKCD